MADEAGTTGQSNCEHFSTHDLHCIEASVPLLSSNLCDVVSEFSYAQSL
jgi:hypothetical protein